MWSFWARAPRRTRGALALALHVALAVPSLGFAHEFWLAPSRYEAGRGEAVEIRNFVGDGFRGPGHPYEGERAVRFTLRGSREHSLAPLARDGSFVWARFVPADAGGAMVAWESGFSRNELPADRFEAYLKEDGLDSALKLRRASGEKGPGKERYRRCAKTWIAGARDSAAVARATDPIGLPLEIVPLDVPGHAATLRVRVLFEGKPLAGALVRAWRAPYGEKGLLTNPESRGPAEETWQARSDVEGLAVVPCVEAGEWLIGAVHMVPSADRASAEWESNWASLAFGRIVAAPTP